MHQKCFCLFRSRQVCWLREHQRQCTSRKEKLKVGASSGFQLLLQSGQLSNTQHLGTASHSEVLRGSGSAYPLHIVNAPWDLWAVPLWGFISPDPCKSLGVKILLDPRKKLTHYWMSAIAIHNLYWMILNDRFHLYHIFLRHKIRHLMK